LVGDGLQRLQQQRSPPAEKLGAGVQLDIQQVCRGELILAREALLDDARA